MSKIKAWKIRPQGSDPCYFKELGALLEEMSMLLEHAEPDDRIIIDVVEMVDSKFESLPEHGGY